APCDIHRLDPTWADDMDPNLQYGLAGFYALCAVMNASFAWYYWHDSKSGKPESDKSRTAAFAWAGVTALFLLHAVAYALGATWEMPKSLRDGIDYLTNPITYTVLSIVAFAAVIIWRRVFVNPHVAWGILNASLLLGGWSMTDPNFRSIVAKE